MATLPDVRSTGDLGPPPALALAQQRLHAEPGAAAQTVLTLRHTGPRVESYRLDIVGLETGWWQVHPAELELFPGTAGEAVVELRPPAGARAPDAALPFGVRAVSTLDPSRSVVEEGDLEVGRVLELKGEIVPVTSRARWTGRHSVRFTNWGNTAVQLQLHGEDRDTRLAFLVEPAVLTVPVGGSASARVRARVRRPVLRGTATRLPFRIVADQPGAPVPRGPTAALPDPARPVLQAEVDQRPVLTRGVITAMALVLVALVAVSVWLVRLPAVRGATVDDIAPPAPTRVHPGGFVGKGLLVSWSGAAEGASHRVALLRAPAGTPPEKGEAQGWQDAEQGARSITYEVPELAPDQKYCLVVAAVRSERQGRAGAPVCATSPAGALAAPEGVAVTADGEGRARVVWKQAKGVRYRVLSVDADSGTPQGALTGYQVAALATVDTAGTGGCFVVQAHRGKAVSPASSPPQCLEGGGGPAATEGPGPGPEVTRTGGEPDPSPSERPSTGPSPAASGPTSSPDAGWVTVISVHPLVQGVELAKAEADRIAADLRNARIATTVVRSDQPAFPMLARLYGSSYVTLVRADSRKGATDLCATARARTKETYPSCEPVHLEMSS